MKTNEMELKEILKDEDANVVDVRTPEEYQEAHARGSVNIPLDDIPDSLEQFRKMVGPIVLCCRSGMRSQQAMEWLEQEGIENLYNAGGYTDVEKYRS